MDMGKTDTSFDNYRRERKRMQAKLGLATTRPATYDNDALRELEQVEAREVREQRLTREVHEFFASATRQAATIVEKVSKDAEEQAGLRVEQEMESFLIDALARMNAFVVTVLQQKRPPVAEENVEPKMANLPGAVLDEFRWAGTAEVGDKHIGQDPFATDVDEVRAEFRAQVGESTTEQPGENATPIDQHLVAAVTPEAPPADAGKDAKKDARKDGKKGKAAPAADDDAVEPGMPTPAAELERFKAALKSLVAQGTMSKDEARAAWQTRVQGLNKRP
jgi:hypothetical protein